MNKQSTSEPQSNASARSSARSAFRFFRRLPVIAAVAAAVLLACYFGIRYLRFVVSHEETDDAQVEGDISPVLPRVPGYVAQVLVRDNERVAAGQALVAIDAADLDLRVRGEQTALETAEAELRAAEATYVATRATAEVARANIAAVRVQRDKTASDLAQDKGLSAGGAITDRQLRDSQEAADTAAARLEMAEREADAASAQVAVAGVKVGTARAIVARQRAGLDLSKLGRSYATVTAPIAGLVAHKDVEPGQFVQAGQTLMSIASDEGVWVVANFKETQLTHLRPGQAVEFTADSYPGRIFRGRIDSLAGATGARFALLPPDNATGNFVKVTQRVPVKIVLDEPPDAQQPLRPGMSVDVTVDLRK
jgi:membrane fusion protein (multidrug efflux system)